MNKVKTPIRNITRSAAKSRVFHQVGSAESLFLIHLSLNIDYYIIVIQFYC